MEKLPDACQRLKQVKESDGALLILTGAGMSVSSGVPVFRNSDGSMSPDFLEFLSGYNKARRENNLSEADDWFGFSVPEMFQSATETEAWQYWRWRILRARVPPAEDYAALNRITQYFGTDKVFVVTSNCDMLHVHSGADPNGVKEIHGSLGSLQCSDPCCKKLYPVDQEFLTKLSDKKDPNWVPRCPECKKHCLRPNVMIFGDHALVYDALDKQAINYQNFTKKHDKNFVALEVGAGTVVPSIRWEAESKGAQGKGLIRVNPSEEECADSNVDSSKYFPLPGKSKEALEGLCRGLSLL